MPIIEILTIQNCNYFIVGFGLILILTTYIGILSRASVYIIAMYIRTLCVCVCVCAVFQYSNQ